jgi:hypothetical protein
LLKLVGSINFFTVKLEYIVSSVCETAAQKFEELTRKTLPFAVTVK